MAGPVAHKVYCKRMKRKNEKGRRAPFLESGFKTNPSHRRKIMSHLLIFLAIIPIACFQLAKMYAPCRLWLLTGLAAGLVIAPVSQGLVEYTLIPVIGGYIGIIGTMFNLIHGSVGYFFLGAIGTFEPGMVLDASQLILMNAVNAVIWTTYYGVVGYRMDLKFSTKAEKKYIVVAGAKFKHSEDYLQ